MADAPRYVLDASVAGKWHLRDETHAEQAIEVFNDFLSGRIDLIAPSFIVAEVGSAIMKALRRGRIAFEDAYASVRYIEEWDLTWATFSPPRAFLLSQRVGCSYYDAVYLTVAESGNLPLLSADDRLRRAVIAARFEPFLWIGDYQSPEP